MTLDQNTLENVYAIWPNQRTVTLIPHNPPHAPQEIPGCVRRPWDKAAAAGNPVMMEQERCIFMLPTVGMDGFKPRPGDRLVDEDGTAWTILQYSFLLEGTVYRCPVTLVVGANDT